MPQPSPVVDTPDGALLSIHLQPGASCTEYVGHHGGALKFRVAAAPVAGAANDALCTYLAARFGLPRRAVVLLTGATSRRKTLLVRGVTAATVRDSLAGPPSSSV